MRHVDEATLHEYLDEAERQSGRAAGDGTALPPYRPTTSDEQDEVGEHLRA